MRSKGAVGMSGNGGILGKERSSSGADGKLAMFLDGALQIVASLAVFYG
jgi:hypothetical protein